MNDNQIDIVSVRLVKDRVLYSNEKICNYKSAVQVFSDELRMYDREVCAVINLQTDGRPINISIISMGTINASLIDPAQIFKTAILSNAHSIIMLHNHPSGTSLPSRSDINVTKRIMNAGELMGIRLLDHIIVGDYIYSFAEHDMMDMSEEDCLNDIVTRMFKEDYPDLNLNNDMSMEM